jgi:hypothetical protein
VKKKPQVIELEIQGNVVSTPWWTPEIKELFCALCDEESCNPMTCQVANPWCG